jgi:SAM-dependent methyltransferase
MNAHGPFLSPKFTPTNLDRFIVRTAILRALKEALPRLSGTLLDVGCGDMPYKPLLLAPPSQVETYVGLDIVGTGYNNPHVEWDGRTMPFPTDALDCAIATEVLEHCPEPEGVLREICRVLQSGGVFFFTVPFLWPLHDIPCDEYRYTPFALRRHLQNAGFEHIELKALGGWDASLAQMIGLWVRRRTSGGKRLLLSICALPVMRYLLTRDDRPEDFSRATMITGVSGTAAKPLGRW